MVACIVRNFNSLKGRPFAPTRGCTNNTGPSDSSLMAMAIRPSSGKRADEADDRNEQAHRSRDRLVKARRRKLSRKDDAGGRQRLDGELSGEALVALSGLLDHDAAHEARFEQRLNRRAAAPLRERNHDPVWANVVDNLQQATDRSEERRIGGAAGRARQVVDHADDGSRRARRGFRSPG